MNVLIEKFLVTALYPTPERKNSPCHPLHRTTWVYLHNIPEKLASSKFSPERFS